MAGLAKGPTEAEIVRFIGEHYGADIAAFLRIPDLRKVIIEAAQNDYNAALVSTTLRRTKWYRDRSQSMRTIDALRVADPQEYNRLVAEKQKQVTGTMISLGLSGTKAMAEKALRLGWDEAGLREDFSAQLAQRSAARGLAEGSEPRAQADALLAIARQEYLTPVDRQTAERWAIKAYQSGTDVEDQWRSYLGSIAGTRFGIDPGSGITPADVMSPVKMAIAEQLEREPDAIDFLDPQYRDVMQIETSDGKFRPMTAHEAATWARGQDSFKTTKKAQDETASLVETMSKTFGKTA